jgi:sporadic carbohydrate cluster 2OG-Fe(II) oxygenase
MLDRGRREKGLMELPLSFVSEEEKSLSREFMAKGYVICDVDNREVLDEMRTRIIAIACSFLKRPMPTDHGEFLDYIHKIVQVSQLNELRLTIYRQLNQEPWLRPSYFSLARTAVECLVGNELAMQSKVNLSVQMPNDDSSLLDIHADVFGGETPFQVVEWLPLVDVYDTKSMFILSNEKSAAIAARLHEIGDGGMARLYDMVKDDVEWLNVPYGKVLIFTPNTLHGNVVNRVPTTRWSLNSRITGLFTPYTSAEKKIGSYYLPITTRAVSKIGMSYRQPDGFRE